MVLPIGVILFVELLRTQRVRALAILRLHDWHGLGLRLLGTLDCVNWLRLNADLDVEVAVLLEHQLLSLDRSVDVL